MADQPNVAELDQAILEILDDTAGGIRIDTWKSYTINSNFLSPTDSWSCVLGDDSIADRIVGVVKPGTRIRWTISGLTQLEGYVHNVKVSSTRGGTEVTLEGRDVFGPVVDGTMDPTTRFTDGQNIVDVLKAAFGPFGWTSDTQFITDNSENMRRKLGSTPVKTSKKGKPLKSYVLHQLRPERHEGCYHFASRISQRFGLWIWPSGDSNFVICDTPTFDGQSFHKFTKKRGANVDEIFNNLDDSEVCFSDEDQPALIIATGFGSGGEVRTGSLKVAMVNELTLDPVTAKKHPDVAAVLAANPDAKVVLQRPNFTGSMRYKQRSARILYLHDDQSKDMKQLEAFTRREMAVRQRHSLTYDIVIKGHSQGGVPYNTNMMADVDDDVCGVHEPLWILDRTYTKSRREGTKTKMQLIRPYTLDFYQP